MAIWDNKWHFQDSWNLKVRNPFFFEIYTKSIVFLIQKMLLEEDNFDPIKEIFDDLFLLLSYSQDNYFIFGESEGLFGLIEYLYKTPDLKDYNIQIKKKLSLKISKITSLSLKLLTIVCEIYSFHWNASILQKFFWILSKSWDNLIEMDWRREIVTTLQLYTKGLQRLFSANRLRDQMATI